MILPHHFSFLPSFLPSLPSSLPPSISCKFSFETVVNDPWRYIICPYWRQIKHMKRCDWVYSASKQKAKSYNSKFQTIFKSSCKGQEFIHEQNYPFIPLFPTCLDNYLTSSTKFCGTWHFVYPEAQRKQQRKAELAAENQNSKLGVLESWKRRSILIITHSSVCLFCLPRGQEGESNLAFPYPKSLHCHLSIQSHRHPTNLMVMASLLP